MHIKKTVLLIIACLTLVTGVSWAKNMSKTSWTGYNNSYYSGFSATNSQLVDNESSYFTHSFPVKIGEISNYSHNKITVPGLTDWKAYAGEPVLPFRTVKLVVPAGEKLAGVKIIAANSVVLPGSYEIAPAQADVPVGSGLDVPVTQANPEIYNYDGWYPEMPCGNFMVQKMKGYSIVFVNIHPYLYNPVQGQIKYYADFTIELKTVSANTGPGVMRSYSDAERELPVKYNAAREVADFVDNPSYAAEYSLRVQDAMAAPRAAAAGLVTTGNFQYVIVTSEAIKNAAADYTVRDLISYKQSLGLTATIVTMEEITAAYTGVDDAQKLRNFLKDAYAAWQTEYVLLGGDTNIIPVRLLVADNTQLPSDIYYQCLDGPYNADGDANWGETNDGAPNAQGENGEVDLIADIYVGRASAENAVEMSNFIYKTLKYQQENQSAPYLSRSLFFGEYMGSDAWCDKEATRSMEEVRLGSDAVGYTTQGFETASYWTTDLFYHEYEPEKFKNNQYILNKINSDTYSLINHLGHGSTSSGLLLRNGDEAEFTNTNPLFVYSHACYVGSFQVDCLAERLTTSTRTGMFAVLMNSHTGFSSTSQELNRSFWNIYVKEPIRNLGKLQAKSKEFFAGRITSEGSLRWVFFCHTLFGDPHLELPAPDVDLTAPVLAGTPEVTNITHNSAGLQWNAATDNKKIKAYEILEGTKTTLTGFRDVQKISYNSFDNSIWVVDKTGSDNLTVIRIDNNNLRTTFPGFTHAYGVTIEPDPTDGSCWAVDNNRTINLIKLNPDGTTTNVKSFDRIYDMDFNKNSGSLWMYVFNVYKQTRQIIDYRASGSYKIYPVTGSIKLSVNHFDNSTWYLDQHNNKVMRIDAQGTRTEHTFYTGFASALTASSTDSGCWVYHTGVDKLVKYTPGVERPEIVDTYPATNQLVLQDSDGSVWSHDIRYGRLFHLTEQRALVKYPVGGWYTLKDFAINESGSVTCTAQATTIFKMTGNMTFKTAGTDLTNITVGNLKPGTEYTFSVRALDNGGNYSAPTPAVQVITLPPSPPFAPVGLVSTGATNSKITLDWLDNTESDIKGYFVYRRAPSETVYSKITAAPVLTSTYTDQNLANGTTYDYAVTAVNEWGIESLQSAAVSVTTNVNPAYPLWDANGVYTKGMRVTRNGIIYEAYMWNRGRDPELYHQSGWDEWNLIGPE